MSGQTSWHTSEFINFAHVLLSLSNWEWLPTELACWEKRSRERERKKKFVITKNMGGVGWVGCFAVFGGKFIEWNVVCWIPSAVKVSLVIYVGGRSYEVVLWMELPVVEHISVTSAFHLSRHPDIQFPSRVVLAFYKLQSKYELIISKLYVVSGANTIMDSWI